MKKEITIYALLELIKDGKAPKKIKYRDETYSYSNITYFNDKNRNITLLEHVFCTYCDKIALLQKIEILDEENDEFEDIKFEDYGLCWSTDKKEDINSAFRDFSRGIIYNKELIEKLIRNQKKIIERLGK